LKIHALESKVINNRIKSYANVLGINETNQDRIPIKASKLN
jgi:hypothetical protein